jgi:hypothetical protein
MCLQKTLPTKGRIVLVFTDYRANASPGRKVFPYGYDRFTIDSYCLNFLIEEVKKLDANILCVTMITSSGSFKMEGKKQHVVKLLEIMESCHPVQKTLPTTTTTTV